MAKITVKPKKDTTQDFDKFEVELAGSVEEPTNQAYTSAADSTEPEVGDAEAEEEEAAE